MDVSEAHLMQKGYLGVSLEEISREVGVTKPALYYHFPGGKEQLFVEITHRSLRRAREGLECVMSSWESGAEKLRAAAEWLMDERRRVMGRIRETTSHFGEEHLEEVTESFYRDLYSPIHRAIVSGMESGEFRQGNPEFLAMAFLSLASSMMETQDLSAHAGPDAASRSVEQVAGDTLDLFLNGVLS